MSPKNVLIIHDIRSVTNVGAMFRTADAAGINKIYLTGYTPTPLDRFGRIRKDMAKSALGAEKFVFWEYKKSLLALLNILKKCDVIVEIPMRGKKESLNVSVACGIALFRILGI